MQRKHNPASLVQLLFLGTVVVSGRQIRSDYGNPPLVDLEYAKYQGIRLPGGVDQFLGMRYARPPLRELRFRAPHDPKSEEEIQDASTFGPVCIGAGSDPSDTMNEDCLFVNVFKPSSADEHSNLPVWVYIQGGGYTDNANANYNGSEVVTTSNNDMVFVNFNYRVSALGFLASEEVRKDGDLNAGLLDQRKLLHWVQTNIRKFGGNPEHVVIQGASAGGGSVTHHLAAYCGREDNKLFVGAVPESPFWPTLRTVNQMEFQYKRLLKNADCEDLDCLRQLSLDDFQAASPNEKFPAGSDTPLPLWYWLPVIDGSLVPDRFHAIFGRGDFIRVPLLVGDDTDEGSYFAPNASTPEEVSQFFKNNYPHLNSHHLQKISESYPKIEPLAMHQPYFPSASAAYGDACFTCAGNKLAEAMARFYDPSKVWNYRYNVIDPENTANGLGVPHTFESSAIFGVGNAGGAADSYSNSNAAIVPVTMKYFTSFVRALDPNVHRLDGSPHWGSWGRGQGRRLKLQTNETCMEKVPGQLASRCRLWDSLSQAMDI